MRRAPLPLSLILALLALLAVLIGAAQPARSQGDDRVVFAVIGDYGLPEPATASVAALVKGWRPDFIATLGDNDYSDSPHGALDTNVGQYYHAYIAPYRGRYGVGADVNRFFPVLGNHDWDKPGAQPYLDFFTLPGNERYYDVTWGPVRLFALDSDPREPDGVSDDSAQAQWLKARLADSPACWNLVLSHHPPFSSGPHGSNLWLQWPFQAWGADAILSGHDHDYERIVRDGFPYFVNGLGGATPYPFLLPVRGSEARHTLRHGAIRITASRDSITYEFIDIDGALIDSYTQRGGCAAAATGAPPVTTPAAMAPAATAPPVLPTTRVILATTATPTDIPHATTTPLPVQSLALSPPPPAAVRPLRLLEAIRTRLDLNHDGQLDLDDLRASWRGWR